MKVFVNVELTATNFTLDDLTDDMSTADLLALLELESDVPADHMDFFVDNKEVKLADARTRTLAAVGIHNNSRLGIINTAITEAQILPPLLAELRTVRDQLRNDPYQFSIIKQNSPSFADAIVAENIAPFARIVVRQRLARQLEEVERARRIAALEANPFDIEAQRAIEEQIRNENIEELRQGAIEHMPESFGSVVMLYVNVRVNGVPLKAFIDSGAQVTIMSSACAERCNVLRLVDRRYEGMAVGVGSQKIIGRVHMCSLEVAGSFLPTSLSILENQPMDLLVGLDMLRRHQCVIDLRTNELIIGSTGARTPFLSEQDLPDSARRLEAAANDAPSPTRAPTGNFPEAAITELLGLGSYSRAQAIEALTVSNGDIQAAAAYLLGG